MTREEAIKHLSEWTDEKMWRCFGTIDREAIGLAIEALQDKPIGVWIDVNGDGSLWRCDQCKDTACCRGNFCPNCGANMKSEVM